MSISCRILTYWKYMKNKTSMYLEEDFLEGLKSPHQPTPNHDHLLFSK